MNAMAKIEDAAGNCGLFTDGDWILSENMAPEGTIGVIQLKHVGVGEFHDKEFQFISNSTFNELGCTEVRSGDVLISRMADPIGRACIVPQLPFRAVTAVDISILRVDESVADSRFITHLCNSQLVRDRIARAARGTTRSRITRTELGETEIPLPPLPEQRLIAERLEQADRLRHTRRYALELTGTFLPAAFLELFGDPTTNPLGLPVTELGDFLSFVTSGSRGWADHYVPAGARFIRSLDVRMNNISDEDAVFVKPPNNAEADRTRVKPGDVLLTITGSRIGRVAPVPERLNGAFISQHVAILRLKAGLLPEFLSMFLSLDTGGQRQIARVQYGQTKPGLNLNQIREMRMPVPDVCHQQRFLELAKRVERLRAVQREALRQAEHLFASLLDRAFSG